MRHRLTQAVFVVMLALAALPGRAQPVEAIQGQWLFNEKASDKTDDRVEDALKAMGQKTSKGFFSRDDEYYRGGPAEHELYDRISYDRELDIRLEGETFHFRYEDDYVRPVYTDNRHRSVSLTGLDEVEDFSFAHWENGALLVEGRPRDGGFTNERYTLINDGSQLRIELHIEPRSFTVPIEITRVFDRRPPAQ